MLLRSKVNYHLLSLIDSYTDFAPSISVRNFTFAQQIEPHRNCQILSITCGMIKRIRLPLILST